MENRTIRRGMGLKMAEGKGGDFIRRRAMERGMGTPTVTPTNMTVEDVLPPELMNLVMAVIGNMGIEPTPELVQQVAVIVIHTLSILSQMEGLPEGEAGGVPVPRG
jgi:hypothetical protein